jgi:DNA-directed RNA polymerase II subunit RPB1
MKKGSKHPPREYISHVEFGVFSPDEIKRFAVVNVTEPSMYSASLPIANGTADHRMGSVDRRLACGTCKQSINDCPGHAGMIVLNFPVVHPSFLDTILKILKSVCFFCSELLLSEADKTQVRRAKDRKQKLVLSAALAKNKKACPCCTGPVPTYSKQGQHLKCDFSKVKFADAEEAQYCQRPFTAGEVRTILCTVRDCDCLLLGLNPKVSRPEHFVLTVVVVPPPVVRPSVVISEGSKARGQDDLTAKYCDIIKANAQVKLILEKEAGSIPRVGLSLAAQQAVNDLAFHVSTLMNNDLRGQRQSVQRSGLPTKSIMSRLKGKDGRIRGFLMGKRVDFSARSVISPDSQMDVDQVGIPEVVAQRLTVPIHVMACNLELVRGLVKNPGSGARTICRDGKCVTILEFADRDGEAKNLAVGDVVERVLQNDDIVLFNRQPSLHIGSMMGYRVLICKGSRTFRLNLACTGVSNADYDGDEMNVHAPQDPAAQTEARLLMAVPRHIISAQSNKPSIGLVQDTLIGAWLLTADDVSLSRRQLCVLHTCLHYALRPMPPGDVFTGKQAFSLLFPQRLHYQNTRTGVEIEAGELKKGRLCRQTLGTASGSLVHYMWLFQGPKCAQEFLSDAQRLVGRWLQWRGFSIRLSDCEPDAEILSKMKAIVALAESKAHKIATDQGLQGSAPEVLEESISAISNKVLTDAGKIVHSRLDERGNALYQDILSGAKGNLVNIAQLMGLVGQQSVEGQRVDPGAPLTRGLACKGFVKHSYFQGLSSREFFMHTMAGREGLIDTSVKTSSTGYLQRKLMKGMESIRVSYDLTCRNSRQNIVQFEYGADGYDAVYLVRQSMDALRLEPSALGAALTPSELVAFLPCWTRILEGKARRVARELETACYVPVPLDAILKELRQREGPEHWDAPSLLEAVAQLCTDVCQARFGWRHNLELLLRWHFRFGNVRAVSSRSLQEALDLVRETCRRAEVAPGEAIGPLASTSIGEPLTQLTLNTFHRAGIKAHNVTLGVPRIKELIDCTKNPKTPSMHLVVVPSCSAPQMLEKLHTSLVEVHLCAAVSDMRFLEEPDFFSSDHGPLDAELAARLRSVYDRAPAVYGPLVARLRLDVNVLVQRGLSPSDVAALMERHCACHIAASEELHVEWVLRVRFTALCRGTTPFPEGSPQETLHLRMLTEEMTHKLCRDVVLSGVAGVQKAVVQEDVLLRFSPHAGHSTTPCTTISTQGSNLSAVFDMPCFDAARCSSNDVHEVFSVLGIEAATAVLFEQIQFTLQFDGSYINERHLLLLVSFMTCLGGLLPVSRHGINKLVDSGPLARASFEEVADRLAESAIYGDVDPVLCHSSRIMIGEVCKVGTGVCTVEREVTAVASDSEDSVVFTTLDGDAMEGIKSSRAALKEAPIEMPFMEEGTALFPKVVAGGSFIHLPAQQHAYAPSSPKTLLLERKRGHESSPRQRSVRPRTDSEE